MQIWNEPSEYYQWSIPDGQDWAPGYGKLVRKSYKAIKDADPSVKVVLAGLPNTSPQYLDRLYKNGNIHGYFNVAAIHPYTAHKHGVLILTKQFRAVMKKHHDGGKKLWVTELGLPASKDKTSDNSEIVCRLGRKRRFVLTLEWLTLWPTWTPLPVTGHFLAMGTSFSDADR